jgi:hypothetical protein
MRRHVRSWWKLTLHPQPIRWSTHRNLLRHLRPKTSTSDHGLGAMGCPAWRHWLAAGAARAPNSPRRRAELRHAFLDAGNRLPAAQGQVSTSLARNQTARIA